MAEGPQSLQDRIGVSFLVSDSLGKGFNKIPLHSKFIVMTAAVGCGFVLGPIPVTTFEIK
jgi:hypothetical protein